MSSSWSAGYRGFHDSPCHAIPSIAIDDLPADIPAILELLADTHPTIALALVIPNARFVELPGDDHLPFVGDQDALLDEIARFLAIARTQADADRVLVTLLCVEVERLGKGEVPRASCHDLERRVRIWRGSIQTHINYSILILRSHGSGSFG
jgi:hypothetical protein